MQHIMHNIFAFYTQNYMNLDLSGAGAVTTNPFVILSNPEIAILHIELMVTILVTNHRLTVIMLLPCTHHSGSIEVFCDT